MKRTMAVHQALHGYSDGHRLIASSVKLKSKDDKQLLGLSDASGPARHISGRGYLTGYPLIDSGFFALARTWAAPEMPRPGCVWTHTLLIDIADLGAARQLWRLNDCFRRPSGDVSSFETPLQIHDAVLRNIDLTGEVEQDNFERIIGALYGLPTKKIIFPRSERADLDDLVVFRIWEQQWPRLRRSFRFCTLSFGDRSTEATPFDLQFFPAEDRASRSRFGDSVDASRKLENRGDWIKMAAMVEGSGDSLSRFLRKAAVDLSGGRAAFGPLVSIYAALRSSSEDHERLDHAVDLAEGLISNSNDGSALAGLVAARVLSHLQSVSVKSTTFAIEHIDKAVVIASQEDLSVWAQNLWSLAPKLLATHQLAPHLIEFLDRLTVDELITGLTSTPELLEAVLSVRSDLISTPQFWRTALWTSENAGILRGAVASQGAVSVAKAMLQSEATKLVRYAVLFLENEALMSALRDHFDVGGIVGSLEREWCREVFSDANNLAEKLASGFFTNELFLFAVASVTKPDFVPNSFGDDPWWLAISHAKQKVEERERIFLCSYLFARALGQRSRNQGELLAYSFDTLHNAALTNSLEEDAWGVIEPRLPWTLWWATWDRGRRLREAVCDAFVFRGLSPKLFVHVTKDAQLFAELVNSIVGRFGGERFLRSVVTNLHETKAQPGVADQIEEILKSH